MSRSSAILIIWSIDPTESRFPQQLARKQGLRSSMTPDQQFRGFRYDECISSSQSSLWKGNRAEVSIVRMAHVLGPG
jgi:hypothetical protein